MDRLVFGAGPIVLGDKTKNARRNFARLLSEFLGTEVVLVVATSYQELSSLLTRGEAHAAWLPPAVFVRTKRQIPLTRVASSVREGGGGFRGVVFVRQDSARQTAADLVGAKIGWVDRDSCSGYLFPRLALREMGLDPGEVFPDEFLLGSHSAVARSVASGRMDAGATFLDLDGEGNETTPGWSLEFPRGDMKPVLVTEPIPADAICVVDDIPAGIRAALSLFFLRVHEDPISAEIVRVLFSVEKFVESDPSTYEIVERAMTAIPET